MNAILSIWLLAVSASAQAATLQADLAYEKVAYRLELVRNQLELTISNQRSLSNDIRRQQRELEGRGVFVGIPLASKDEKEPSKILAAIGEDLGAPASGKTGFKLTKAAFDTNWRSAPRKVPPAVGFDEGYRAPEEQIADQRQVELVFRFAKAPPANPVRWFEDERARSRRLLVPTSTKVKGKNVHVQAWIYRFRDFEYPKMLAPDLSRYQIPGSPGSPTQKAAATRIERYRREIPMLWPKAQPYVDDIRQFALNDLRMNFFMKRANVHRH